MSFFKGFAERWKNPAVQILMQEQDTVGSEVNNTSLIVWSIKNFESSLVVCMSDQKNCRSEGNWFCSVRIRLCFSPPPEALWDDITGTFIAIEMIIFSGGWWDGTRWFHSAVQVYLDVRIKSWSVWHFLMFFFNCCWHIAAIQILVCYLTFML